MNVTIIIDNVYLNKHKLISKYIYFEEKSIKNIFKLWDIVLYEF